ncbi:hypothetical protein [Paracoccus sp. (in: a-proteobacteria)]|uniref:hypothetical protein n=1 Tax=Paracoccus sp. TaxID=267 RepID=UPI00272B8F8F|nr:hypothetical protein [Paracoccus sp. (in: a-proteobacteria)]
MNNMVWLLRAVKWARNPPSARMVRLVLAVIGVALLIVLAEWLDLWPDWATLDQGRAPRLPR